MTNQPKLPRSDQKSVSFQSLAEELNQLAGNKADDFTPSLSEDNLTELRTTFNIQINAAQVAGTAGDAVDILKRFVSDSFL